MASGKKYQEPAGSRICNICGLPGVVTYYEFDDEKGTKVQKKHKCGCLGHEGIVTYSWNRAPGFANPDGNSIRALSYDDYKKFYVRLKRKYKQIKNEND